MERPPYDATAVRPAWADLPHPVRAHVVGWTGEPVDVRSAGGGFTRGFAATLTAADGRSSFVKAVPESVPHIAASYRREAQVHAVLPASAPTPRLRHEGSVDADGDTWVVLVLEHVDGRMPGLPWTDHDLRLCVRALEQLAASMRDLDWHADASILEFADGDDLVGLWSAYAGAGLPDGLDDWAVEHRDDLVAATAHAGDALRGEDWTHADVRGDNLLVGVDRAWVVDWNWLCRGPAWADLGLLLPMVHADGVDLAPAYASSLLADVPAADLDAGIAWLAALMLAHVDDPVFPGGSPWLRPHQRWTARACLSLLRERWSAGSGGPDGR